jgi:hypothetical protein
MENAFSVPQPDVSPEDDICMSFDPFDLNDD